MPDALFERDGTRFVPTELCRGPWSPDAQHGGPPAALMARAAEGFEGGEEMQAVRQTVELLRPVPLVPLTVTAAGAEGADRRGRAPRGRAVHQPRPHHLPAPHARGRVGMPRGGDLGRAARRGHRREPPVGRARPDRPRDPDPAPRSGALRGCDDVNLWAAIILAALLLDFAVERLADVLDLGRLGRTLPPE